MAKISMDASEWEAMKKNEKLLEEALARGKEQSEKIEKLQEEKIEAMELNSKKVTIVEEVHTVERLLCRNSPSNILKSLDAMYRAYKNGKDWPNHSDPMLTGVRGMGYGRITDVQMYREIGILQDLFYTEKNEVRNQDGVREKTVTYRGLDQVKADLRDEYLSKLKAETKAELKEGEKAFKKNAKLVQDKKDLRNELKLANGNLTHAEKDIKKLTAELKIATKRNESLADFDKLRQATLKVLTVTEGRFGNKKAIDQLKEVWQD